MVIYRAPSDRIHVKQVDKRRIPYAIAVVEEHKAEYEQWDFDIPAVLNESEVNQSIAYGNNGQ